MKKSGKMPLIITIVGGRIRTISDMIREIRVDIEQQHNITFIIYCLHPDFAETWGLPLSTIEENIVNRNKTFADLITKFSEELKNYNDSNSFQKNNLKIEVKFYREPPFIYCYLIGTKELYWGYYTWNSNYKDFEGPINPCYYLKNVDSEFSSIYEWLSSRLPFHDLSGVDTI